MENKKDNQIGVINEVGYLEDLGLGFHSLSEEDQKILDKQKEKKEEENN